MLIRPVGTEFLHADRRTDTKQRKVAFRNIANTSKNFTFCPHSALQRFTGIPQLKKKKRISSYATLNDLSFVMDIPSVYCAVRTGSLNKAHYVLSLKGYVF